MAGKPGGSGTRSRLGTDQLGTPGTVTSVDVATSFFTGNFPVSCAIQACGAEGYPAPAELLDPADRLGRTRSRSPLRGDTRKHFPGGRTPPLHPPQADHLSPMAVWPGCASWVM